MRASSQVAAQRESFARATAALDRAIDVLLPREAGGVYSAHGTAAMPVWGTIFRAFEPNDTMVEVRIDNLIRYLESVQVSGAGTHDAQ